jgi:hypothetical protein
MAPSRSKQLVVCISNDGFQASLERRKIYVSLPDLLAGSHDLIRIVDESGEDYLYPRALFREISVPESLKKMLLSAA